MENNSPIISVLLPIYNTNPIYLKECIESILSQTFKDFELIILNDASTEILDNIINSYDDKRIRYYKNKTNLGITKTRNKLLELANCKYVAITDHDDISTSERFEKEYNFLEQNPEVSIVSGWIEVFNTNLKKKKIWKTKPYPKILDFLVRCELIHPACMWRKADFEKYNLKYEEDYYGAQDYALFSKAVRYLKFANIQEVLLKYRKHDNNASNEKRKMCFETVKIQNEILDFLTFDNKKKIFLYEKFAFPNEKFIHKIFSIKNVYNYKIIRILGLKIKILIYKI